jgi:hypothetical protein
MLCFKTPCLKTLCFQNATAIAPKILVSLVILLQPVTNQRAFSGGNWFFEACWSPLPGGERTKMRPVDQFTRTAGPQNRRRAFMKIS